MVFGDTRVHSPWRSVAAGLTAVSAHTVASLVMLWPRVRLRPAPARLAAPISIFLFSLPLLLLLLLLQQLLTPLLLLHLLPVTRPGTLQPVSH